MQQSSASFWVGRGPTEGSEGLQEESQAMSQCFIRFWRLLLVGGENKNWRCENCEIALWSLLAQYHAEAGKGSQTPCLEADKL